jgi:hypothetical protein
MKGTGSRSGTWVTAYVNPLATNFLTQMMMMEQSSQSYLELHSPSSKSGQSLCSHW